MYFRNYRLRKTWLDKFLTSRFSEDPSTDNTENGSKHFCNLYDSTFTKFISDWESTYARKSLF